MVRVVLLAVAVAAAIAAPAAAQDEFELPPGATVVAGTGESATTDEERADGGPATEAAFQRIASIDLMGDGSLLVADSFDERIRRIRPDGTISTNAGPDDEIFHPVAVVGTTWAPGAPSTPNGFVAADVNGGVGQAAMWSQVATVPGDLNSIHLEKTTMTPDEDEASDVDKLSDGTGYFVAQSGVPGADNGRVLIARFNEFTHQWDVAPVLENLADSQGLGALPGNGFLVTTDFGDCRVLRRQDGVTTVMAGTGECAEDDPQTPGTGPLPGNGGPATSAELRRPLDVVATPDGGFAIAEGALVRHVSPDGIISTLFDTALWFTQDIPPTPEAIEVLPDGDILVGVQRRILRFDSNFAPPAGPGPGPGPQNPSPPIASPGPNPSPPAPVSATLGKAKYKVVKGRKLKLSFTATAAGTYTLDVRKGGKRVKRFQGDAREGETVRRLKLGLKAGRYTLALAFTGPAGAQATDTAKLRIKRRS